MIQKLAEHRIAFLLLVTLLLIQSFNLDLSDPSKKPITGDAQAYYAYLPAIFIYQDWDYKFLPEMQEKYYTPGSTKSFLKDVNGEKVNKTFPGVTILYLPFFLAAHGTSLLLGLPADGYAYTYQLFYLIGFWFYVLLGAVFFRKVLVELEFKKSTADLSLVILFLGTNLFFFTVYDQTVTHLHNFFLVNWSVYLTLKLKKQFELKKLILLTSILALIGIIRPTNILVLGVLLFFVPEWAFYKRLFGSLFKPKSVFKTLLVPFLILSIPFILWKLQTGNWIVYSYGDEGFAFLHPELFNFLFSYTKGWFLYTPLILFIFIVGFILLFKENQRQFFIGVLFFSIAIYIFSSWWCWYYGAGLSQRVMIDFYIIPGFLLALILRKFSGLTKQSLGSRLIGNLPLFGVIVPLLLLNVFQSYQVAAGIFPFGSPTKEQYWNNFFTWKKKAEVYPQDHWQLITAGTVSFNPADNQILKGEPRPTENDWCLSVSEAQEYSGVATIPQQVFKQGSKLIFSFDARADSDVEETRVVFVFANSKEHVFFLKSYISDTWTPMQYLVEFDTELSSPVDIYLWNAGKKEAVEMRNLSWKLYFTDNYF